MSKALYRKHRSTSLNQIVGQDHITAPLSRAIADNNIAHAYLFIGPRGTGKTSIARILAHEINHFPYEIEDNYLDIIEIDAASNTGVDNIRDLREKALIAPTKGKYKIYIIDEIHMLSKPAFNALLKILEEPPAHIIFIMATTDAHKIPITISSRSQVFNFKLAPESLMVKHLRKISNSENIQITDEALTLIAKLGGGSFRDSISLLDQISNLSQGQITKDLIIQSLGLPQDEIILSILSAFTKNDTQLISSTIQELISKGIRPETIAEELINIIIKNPNQAHIKLLSDLIEVPKHDFPLAKLLTTLIKSSPISLNDSPSNQPQSSSQPPSYKPTQSTPQPIIQQSTPQPTIQQPQPKYSPRPTFQKPNISPVTKTAQPQEHLQPTLQAPITSESFNWVEFIKNISVASLSLSTQLKSATYSLQGNQLSIIPASNIAKKILDSPNNKNTLIKYLGSLELIITNPQSTPTEHSAQPKPASPKPQPTTSSFDKISAIMGEIKEVKIDNDNLPV